MAEGTEGLRTKNRRRGGRGRAAWVDAKMERKQQLLDARNKQEAGLAKARSGSKKKAAAKKAAPKKAAAEK